MAAAVRWLYDHASRYGYDQEKIFIGGYSSGAHLAALISLDERYLEKVGLSTNLFKGVIPISGTYDIVDYHQTFLNGNRPELAEWHVEAVFGSRKEDLVNASPTTYLQNLETPMLVMCDNDLYNYTKLFEERIQATDFRDMQVVYTYDLSHGGLWRNLASDDSRNRNIILEFIRQQLKR